MPKSRQPISTAGKLIDLFGFLAQGFLEDLLLRTARRLIIFSARSGQGRPRIYILGLLNTPMDARGHDYRRGR